MLPSHTRLSRTEFSTLLAEKDVHVVFNRVGTIKYRYTSSDNRFSVVTSSKQEKKAVRRNTIRRWAYTIIGQSPISLTTQGILFVSRQSYSMSFVEFNSLLHELFEKIRKNTQ